MKIVYVDDDVAMLFNMENMMTPFLGSKGKFIREPSSEIFCKKIERGEHSDVEMFLIDYSMPVFNGVEVIKKIKEMHSTEPPYIIMYTGNKNQIQGASKVVLDKYGVDIMEKPGTEELLEVVLEYIDAIEAEKC